MRSLSGKVFSGWLLFQRAVTCYAIAIPGRLRSIGSSDVYRGRGIGGEVKVDLRKAAGAMDLEWIDPASGERVEKGSAGGGAERTFRSPLQNDALLWIRARARESRGEEKERS